MCSNAVRDSARFFSKENPNSYVRDVIKFKLFSQGLYNLPVALIVDFKNGIVRRAWIFRPNAAVESDVSIV